MKHSNALIAVLFLCLLPLPSLADKPGPVVPDPYQRAMAAMNAGRYVQAREMLLPLAESGDVRAQYAIGRLYEKGWGVSRDFKTAGEWYRKAADKGHPPSEYRMAVGYAAGLGVRRDEAEALVWLRRAAHNGHKRAQKTLARAYEQGRLGLAADPEQAKYWYDKADSGS